MELLKILWGLMKNIVAWTGALYVVLNKVWYSLIAWLNNFLFSFISYEHVKDLAEDIFFFATGILTIGLLAAKLYNMSLKNIGERKREGITGWLFGQKKKR